MLATDVNKKSVLVPAFARFVSLLVHLTRFRPVDVFIRIRRAFRDEDCFRVSRVLSYRN